MNTEQFNAYNAHYQRLSITNNFYQSICETVRPSHLAIVKEIDWDAVMHRMWERGVCVAIKGNCSTLPGPQFEPITSINAVAKGDLLLINGKHAEGDDIQLHKVLHVKVTEQDGTEIILRKKGNVYFNLGMYLDRKSWVKEASKVIVTQP